MNEDTQRPVSQLEESGYACMDTIQEIVTKLGGTDDLCRVIASFANSHSDASVLEELKRLSNLLNTGDVRR